jgi:hypothetical protein
MRREREESGSSNGNVHLYCLELTVMASSPQLRKAMGGVLIPLVSVFSGVGENCLQPKA